MPHARFVQFAQSILNRVKHQEPKDPNACIDVLCDIIIYQQHGHKLRRSFVLREYTLEEWFCVQPATSSGESFIGGNMCWDSGVVLVYFDYFQVVAAVGHYSSLARFLIILKSPELSWIR